MRPTLLPLLLLATAATTASLPARAAESYDSCAGTISSLPAVITSQGVWCLKGDLATASTSGAAITVAANNVTIDCNGFKLGGLAAGPDSQAVGIRATDRANATVRGCTLRGFLVGVEVGGTGHIVEDNRIEGSHWVGIRTSGDGSVVRRNLVIDTGGARINPYGIEFNGDTVVVDNIVAGVFPKDVADDATVIGIGTVTGSDSQIRGNVVRGLTSLDNGGTLIAIRTSLGESDVADNFLSATKGTASDYAVYCAGQSGFVHGNRAAGFDVLAHLCPAGTMSGNLMR